MLPREFAADGVDGDLTCAVDAPIGAREATRTATGVERRPFQPVFSSLDRLQSQKRKQ